MALKRTKLPWRRKTVRQARQIAKNLIDKFLDGYVPIDRLLNNVEIQKMVAGLDWNEVLSETAPVNPGAYSKMRRALNGLNPNTVWWRVDVQDDDRLCSRCRAWKGRVLSNNDPTLQTPDDWIEAGGCHPRCRCALTLVDPKVVWRNLSGGELMSWIRLNQ